tara:strand:+ start:1141 stop:1332 length:192 start_codon:yes stop_codon:yes gene_type:complete
VAAANAFIVTKDPLAERALTRAPPGQHRGIDAKAMDVGHALDAHIETVATHEAQALEARARTV